MTLFSNNNFIINLARTINQFEFGSILTYIFRVANFVPSNPNLAQYDQDNWPRNFRDYFQYLLGRFDRE